MSAQTMRVGATNLNPRQVAANAAAFRRGGLDASCDDAIVLKSSWRVHYCPDSTDMLSAVEDVWLRLASSQGLKFASCWDGETQTHTVMFRTLDPSSQADAQVLLQAAADSALYTWQEGNQISNLCGNVQWIGATLVIELQPISRLLRCTDGLYIVHRLEALLLKASSCAELQT